MIWDTGTVHSSCTGFSTPLLILHTQVPASGCGGEWWDTMWPSSTDEAKWGVQPAMSQRLRLGWLGCLVETWIERSKKPRSETCKQVEAYIDKIRRWDGSLWGGFVALSAPSSSASSCLSWSKGSKPRKTGSSPSQLSFTLPSLHLKHCTLTPIFIWFYACILSKCILYIYIYTYMIRIFYLFFATNAV